MATNDETRANPTPKAAIPWLPNPAYHDAGPYPPMLVGDRFLIAVPLSKGSGGGFDLSVIVANENGFDDSDGGYWSAWDWSDVEYYVPLDGARKEECD